MISNQSPAFIRLEINFPEIQLFILNVVFAGTLVPMDVCILCAYLLNHEFYSMNSLVGKQISKASQHFIFMILIYMSAQEFLKNSIYYLIQTNKRRIQICSNLDILFGLSMTRGLLKYNKNYMLEHFCVFFLICTFPFSHI